MHSNGYSLVRKLYAESGLGPEDIFPSTNRTVAEVLLEPTHIYVEAVRNVSRDWEIHGMVHVTGGGFYNNRRRRFSCPTRSPYVRWRPSGR